MTEKEVQRLKRRLFSTRKEIASGLSMVLLFGVIAFVFGSRFWLIPMVFTGVLPVVRGISRVGGIKSRLRTFGYEVEEENIGEPVINAPQSRGKVESKILRAAQTHKGIITPAIVALETELPIEVVEKELQDFSSKGYASMEINENGRIEYHFDEFK
jgi:hypothetical protein